VRGEHLDGYAHRVLTPAEVLIFVRYRERLSGRVLDLGCGAGRTLGYLVALGAETHGIDIAPAMVEHCRQAFPAATVRVGELTSLGECVDGSFDAVLATDNLFDVLDDAERQRALKDIRDLLTPEGLLIFSSHDLGYLDAHPGPREWEMPSRTEKLRKLAERSPVDLFRAIGRRRRAAANRRRLMPLQQRSDQRFSPRLQPASLLHPPRRPGAPARGARFRDDGVHRRGRGRGRARRKWADGLALLRSSARLNRLEPSVDPEPSQPTGSANGLAPLLQCPSRSCSCHGLRPIAEMMDITGSLAHGCASHAC
jgi:SAM-dependent methyltransferase